MEIYEIPRFAWLPRWKKEKFLLNSIEITLRFAA